MPHRCLMLHYYFLVAFLVCFGGIGCFSLGGCAKPKDLPEVIVRASTAGELATYRTELSGLFTAEQLSPLDTALQELQLDAMNRNVPTAEARELDMLTVVNGKTVQQTLLLGWQARRHRLLREIAFMTGQVEHNLMLQQQSAAAGTPESVLTHLHNAQDILARLHRDLTATESRLTEWGAALEPATALRAEQKPSG
jgi:hypothetical protein